MCGTAFADFVYINYDGNLTYVDAQGNSQETDIQAQKVFAFNHKGSPRILITDRTETDIISVYDPSDLSAPLARADIYPDSWTVFEPETIAEFGSNIVLSSSMGLIEINPETCGVVSSWVQDGYSANGVYAYKGQLVVRVLRRQGSSGGVSYGNVIYMTMDRVGHITGTFDEVSVNGELETSGGELYFALGKSGYYVSDIESNYHGIYRVSKMIGDMHYYNAEILTTDYPCNMSRDGKGGLYYSVWYNIGSAYEYDTSVRYIYHWDGTRTSLVYDAGENGEADGIAYDIRNGILYANILNNGINELAALIPDSTGQLQKSYVLENASLLSASTWAVTGNPSDSSGGNVTPSPQPESNVLPSAVIEPVVLSDDVLENLAELMNIDKSEIKFITQENISSPKDPTDSMKKYMHDDGHNVAYKLNSLTVNEDGYYVFLVNIPEEFIGKKVSSIKIYALKDSDFRAAFYSLVNGILNYGEITNLLGVKIDTLEGKVLTIGFLQAGTSFSMYLAKLILMLLAGGCNTGIYLAVSALILIAVFKFSRR